MSETAIDLAPGGLALTHTSNGPATTGVLAAVDVSAAGGVLRLTGVLTVAAPPANSNYYGYSRAFIDIDIETSIDAVGSTGWVKLTPAPIRIMAAGYESLGSTPRFTVHSADKFVRLRYRYAGAASASFALTGTAI